MSDESSILKKRTRKEIGLLAGLLFFGVVLLPGVIYLVGRGIFGSYGGQGFGDFFGNLSGKIRAGDAVAWFLVLSPYLVWQTVRLMALAWRYAGRGDEV